MNTLRNSSNRMGLRVKPAMMIVMAFGFFFLLASCAIQSAATFSEGPPLIEPASTRFDTFTVTRGNVGERQMLVGVVRVYSEPLSFGVDGLVFDEAFVDVGDEVREGDILARGEVAFARERVEALEEQLARARQFHAMENERLTLEMDILILDYNRATRRAAEAFGEYQERFLAEAEGLRIDIEWARLIQSQALENQSFAIRDLLRDISELRESIEHAYLIAPFDGVVTAWGTFWGGILQEDTPVVYIAPHRPPFIEYVDMAFDLRDFRLATRVTAHTEDRVFELELMDITRDEIIHYSNMVPTGQNTVFPIRFRVLAEEDELPPVGTLVTIFMYSQWHENVLRVPGNAFFPGTFGEGHVHRVEDDHLVQVPVRASITSSWVAIFDGLEEGDVVFVRP